jgi:predicted DCC family thiol-disulfide oxidoreductase YuxK
MQPRADRWSPHPVQDIPDGTVLYDGVCVLCSNAFRFVAARDPEARFRFTEVQDPLGRRLALQLGIDPDNPESNAVVLDGMGHMKSDAALAVLGQLPRWSWVRPLRHIPRGWRNLVYDLIARNRYRLFGRTETCMVPDASLRRHVAREP